ncbi:MAG TPA: hypothetical protein VJH94_00075 [Candidatus Paceibacterota bacterium]
MKTKPTPRQQKFFERNRLILPETGEAAESTIRFINEGAGAEYLDKINLVRSIQTHIGSTLDTGETVIHFVFLGLDARLRAQCPASAYLQKPDGTRTSRTIAKCRVGGIPMWQVEDKNAFFESIDWTRFNEFKRLILEQVGKLAAEFAQTNPQWSYRRNGGYCDCEFWVNPRSTSVKRAVRSGYPIYRGESLGYDIQYVLPTDDELQKLGELIAAIPLPNGVFIRKLPTDGICQYKITIKFDLFKKV